MSYVKEYHSALKHLEELGFDVEEFKVPGPGVEVHTSGFLRSALWDDSGQRRVQRGFLLAKLDAVIAYFELATQRPPATIGFKLNPSR